LRQVGGLGGCRLPTGSDPRLADLDTFVPVALDRIVVDVQAGARGIAERASSAPADW